MKKSKIGYSIIASAVVWGAVMIACGSVLAGTPYKQDITNILIAGASIHLLFIWGPLGNQLRKKMKIPANFNQILKKKLKVKNGRIR